MVSALMLNETTLASASVQINAKRNYTFEVRDIQEGLSYGQVSIVDVYNAGWFRMCEEVKHGRTRTSYKWVHSGARMIKTA